MVRALLLLLVLAMASGARGQAPVPALTGRVVDNADLLSVSASASIEVRLSVFESMSGPQVAVLTIPSLEGAVLEQYATEVFRTWGLGDVERDDGVLLLIARDDRKLRIEVGYGLEAMLTDAEAGRIIRQVIVPQFRSGDFEGGILVGTDAILATLETGLASGEARAFAPEAYADPYTYTPRWGLDDTVLVGLALAAILASLVLMWGFWTHIVPVWVRLPAFLPMTALGGFLFWGAVTMVYEATFKYRLFEFDHGDGITILSALGVWAALALLGEIGFWRQRPVLNRWRYIHVAQRRRENRLRRDAAASKETVTIRTWKRTYVFDGAAAARRSSSSSYGGSSGGSFGGGFSGGGGGFSGGGGSSGGGGASGGW